MVSVGNGKSKELDLRDSFIDISWKIIEAKILYYQPNPEWDQEFIDNKMPTDSDYDDLEQGYLTICGELGEYNDLVHKAYPGFEDVLGDGMMEVNWDDPDVQEVYEVLCENFTEWKRKKLKKAGTLKKNRLNKAGRNQWEVWEGYAYPEEEDVWRRHYQFLAKDYHHAIRALQAVANCGQVQVFTPALESVESANIKKQLKKEPFLVLGEE